MELRNRSRKVGSWCWTALAWRGLGCRRRWEGERSLTLRTPPDPPAIVTTLVSDMGRLLAREEGV